MKRGRFEFVYGELGRLLGEPGGERRDEILDEAFGSANPHLVARAAQVVAEEVLPAWQPRMLELFERFFRVEDPGCGAKTALADALDFVDCDDDGPFRRGLVWREEKAGPPGAPPVDPADNLRSRCCLALARLGVDDVLHLLADALDDPIATVRAAAAKAIAFHGAEAGGPLLRFKLRLGDRDPFAAGEVVHAVTEAYLRLAPDLARPLVEAALEAGPHEDATALALGDARPPFAHALLSGFTARSRDLRDLRAGLIGLLLLRDEEATGEVRSLAAGEGRRAELAVELLNDFGLGGLRE